MIWREKRTPLIILGVLLLANVLFFFTYRVQYQSRLDSMDERLAAAEGQLEKSRRAHAEAEQTVQAYRKVEHDVQEIFDEHWSTQPRRLTLLIAEVKRLAEASNAVPKSYGFQQADVQETTGRRNDPTIGAREVGISFSVTATYREVRRLINLLELSQQFVIIDEIALAAADGDNLNLNLHLKTLFRDNQPVAAGNRL